MDPNKDKRVSDHLANERTFLAWIRTSIGITGDYRSSSPLIWVVTGFIVLVSVLLIVYLVQLT